MEKPCPWWKSHPSQLNKLNPLPKLKALTHRPLPGCEGMLGNQDKMEGKSKVCMEIQSQLILLS